MVACGRPASEEIATEMEHSLRTELLAPWYPNSLDTVNGGFLSDFTYDWKAEGRQNKMLVTQTRHVWTSSQAARFLRDDTYRRIAKHGFTFLRDKMWDEEFGGFFMLRDTQGGPVSYSYGDEKRAYGNSFAIYALASYFHLSGDSSALNLAKDTFHWLEKHSHDPEHKGYFDRMLRDGTLPQRDQSAAIWDARLSGLKDQNSSIHLMESFSELYRVWPDPLLRERLLEMLTLIRDTITTPKGYLTLFLERDWTPISFRDAPAEVRESNYHLDHVSFGHDVETAFLMLEASHVLGLESDEKTMTVAKRMVDHALANGWDDVNGGLYYEGYYFAGTDTITIIDESKNWWVQAEMLNALLLMSKLHPDEARYYDAFKKQWAYIDKYMIDHEHGGWFIDGLDKDPDRITAPKGSDWKINYHDGRALMNCIKMLRGEHELTARHK
jgi:mannobiose 2-epimerase